MLYQENMKHRLSKILGIKEPDDGFTEEEEMIARTLSEYTVQDIYAKLPTSRMKAVVALHFELGYPQETIANIFHVSQEQIALEVENIRKVLRGDRYKPHQVLPTVRAEDLIQMIIQLQQL